MTKTGLIIRHVPHEGIAGFREPVEAVDAGRRMIAQWLGELAP